MTAVAVPARAGRTVPASLRLTRIELRRNVMLWMLPVAVALFWYHAYRRSMSLPAMWNLRAMTLQNEAPLDFAIPVAGAAAWMGWRESRRQMGEMLAGMPRARFARQFVTWAATTAWALLGYLACTGVVYVITARQATGGGPLWWPLIVGVTAVVALSAFGFVFGALLPSRFTAPLVVIVAFFGLGFSVSGAPASHSPLLVSPLIAGSPNIGADPGVAAFYRYLPDLSIVQVMFAAGLTLGLLGLLWLAGLPGWPGTRARGGGGWPQRAAAIVLVLAGVGAAGTALSLAASATLDAHGMLRIAAVHDAADDQPLPYTPACAGTPVRICVNPMYQAFLPQLTSTLEPGLAQLAGLPRVPVRLNQVAPLFAEAGANGTNVGRQGSSLPGPFILPGVPGAPFPASQFTQQLQANIAAPLAGRALGLYEGTTSSAQQAVFAAVTGLTGVSGDAARQLGVEPGFLPSPGSPAAAAAERFAALPVSTRHTWLVEHITALRSGQLPLSQLP